MQLLGHRLGERRAGVLSELDLAGEDGDAPVLGDVEPGPDLGRERLPAAPAGFLTERGVGDEEHDEAAQALEEVAPLDVETVGRSHRQLGPVRLETRLEQGRLLHGAFPPVRAAARRTACTMRP